MTQRNALKDLAIHYRDHENAFAAHSWARTAARAGLYRLLYWQLGRAVLRLGTLGAMAFIFGRLIVGQDVAGSIIAVLVVSLLGTTVGGLMAERAQAAAEAQISVRLRDAVTARLQAMELHALRSLPVGAMTVGLQRYPEAVAALVIGHRAASMMMAIGPLVAATALAVVSWQAALLMLGLTPVMIIFFALVGETIRSRASAQEKAFGHLAGHFADRLRTLPTILANDAFAAEAAKLADRLNAYVDNTMAVLRIAFLNAGIIDFFASLSIAMLAVFLGLGHLKMVTIPGFSHLALWQSFFILMIAPEYYAWFRRFSEQYHAKAEGLAAATALDNLLADRSSPMPLLPDVERALAQITLPSRGLVVLAGPSGAGKSTLLRRLGGIEPSSPSAVPRSRLKNCVWIATDSFVPDGSLEEAITKDVPPPCPTRLRYIAARLGLIDEDMLPGGLSARIVNGGANLSGGQRLRITVARAFLAKGTVVADEPTAKLDQRNAAAVRRVLREMASKRLVIIASHDRNLIELADYRIDLSGDRPCEAAA